MKKVILASNKGGSGKTLLSVNLSAYLSDSESKVLLVDYNRYQDCLNYFRSGSETLQTMKAGKFHKNIYPNLDIFTCSLDYKPEQVEQVFQDYDYIIFDYPEQSSELLEKLTNTNVFIILENQPLNFKMLPEILEILKEKNNNQLKGIILNQVIDQEDFSIELKDYFQENLQRYLLKYYISFFEDANEAMIEQVPLVNYSKNKQQLIRCFEEVSGMLN